MASTNLFKAAMDCGIPQQELLASLSRADLYASVAEVREDEERRVRVLGAIAEIKSRCTAMISDTKAADPDESIPAMNGRFVRRFERIKAIERPCDELARILAPVTTVSARPEAQPIAPISSEIPGWAREPSAQLG